MPGLTIVSMLTVEAIIECIDSILARDSRDTAAPDAEIFSSKVYIHTPEASGKVHTPVTGLSLRHKSLLSPLRVEGRLDCLSTPMSRDILRPRLTPRGSRKRLRLARGMPSLRPHVSGVQRSPGGQHANGGGEEWTLISRTGPPARHQQTRPIAVYAMSAAATSPGTAPEEQNSLDEHIPISDFQADMSDASVLADAGAPPDTHERDKENQPPPDVDGHTSPNVTGFAFSHRRLHVHERAVLARRPFGQVILN
jgi:hypothetical protein